MDILSEAYYKSAAENEKNLRFWENYLRNLEILDLSVFSDKLKVPVLVPIGSRISFRGELKHTNEITVALGADYFVKCSLKQADILRQHRIKDAKSKVDMFKKEKKFLENQMSFTKKVAYNNQGQEIIEDYKEEEDKEWRQKHRENVRQYKQNQNKQQMAQSEDITDEELWNRLEELELQEELEDEVKDYDNQSLLKVKEKIKESHPIKEIEQKETVIDKIEKEIKGKSVFLKDIKTPTQTSKFELLQQVIDKQNELEEKLFELKTRERSHSKNPTDVMSRLDELEQLEELEDEMDRLDDIIENEDIDDDDDEEYEDNSQEKHTHNTKKTNLHRRVSFVDEDDSETVEINFEHSPVDPKNEPYDPNKGIGKPSDIYEAHFKGFGNGTTSILKKPKYEAMHEVPEISTHKQKAVQFVVQKTVKDQTIVVKDVMEKVNQVDHNLVSQARPTSLFKKKRMQNKS